MPPKKQFVSWTVFVIIIAVSYVFILFYLPKITLSLFNVGEKKIHVQSTTQAIDKIDKKADVTIDKASVNFLKDSAVVKDGKSKKIKVDTGKPLGGLRLLLVNMFNNSRLPFSLLVVGIMVVLGVSVGYITEFILKLLGLDVSKIQHHE